RLLEFVCERHVRDPTSVRAVGHRTLDRASGFVAVIAFHHYGRISLRILRIEEVRSEGEGAYREAEDSKRRRGHGRPRRCCAR
ncbi:MAG: hypothetical protein ABI200_01640, partial [Gaiellales bacterium]